MAEIALAFSGVCKSFGAQRALADLTLEVHEGELFGLVGVNGAGKTTLLKCLLDFATPEAGQIRIFGEDHRQRRARAPLTFLPERFLPPYYLTGGDFLRYMLALHGVAYSRPDVHQTLDDLDLDRRVLERTVRSFSKGMTQKLGIAACLLANKRLYVFDEPSSGLDPKARALLKRQLLGLRDRGRTLFLTSHLLADVGELCDRMAILHDGRLRFVGSPAELLACYRSADIEQAFLGCISAGETATPAPTQSVTLR
jgi:ABC-2 type transport system ATP-binding protein